MKNLIFAVAAAAVVVGAADAREEPRPNVDGAMRIDQITFDGGTYEMEIRGTGLDTGSGTAQVVVEGFAEDTLDADLDCEIAPTGYTVVCDMSAFDLEPDTFYFVHYSNSHGRRTWEVTHFFGTPTWI